MKIGVFGTGMVDEALASKFVSLGHEVRMGSRTANNEKAAAWAGKAGALASQGTFAATAAFGELLVNCTQGTASVDVLRAAGNENLAGKILLDVSNPLLHEPGKGVRLAFGMDDSLGERLQALCPELRVVKTLNTVNCSVMVDPGRAPGEHSVFVCGNDPAAKREVERILREWLGWQDVIDLGDISAARATESYMLLWLKLWSTFKTLDLNIQVQRAVKAPG
jgi:predicted dinucleotide-binding enzyme